MACCILPRVLPVLLHKWWCIYLRRCVDTVLINNSSNINKNTSHLKSLNTKRSRNVTLEIQVLTEDRHTCVVGLHPTAPLLIIESSTTYIYKQTIKIMHIFACTQNRPHTIPNMNDNINMDSTIASGDGSVFLIDNSGFFNK